MKGVARLATAVGWALASMVGLLLGCGDDLPPLRMESAHFRYYAHEDEWICPNMLGWLEHHYATVGAFLGVSIPAGEKFSYYKFHDEADLATNACGVQVTGCADGRSAFSAVAYHPHELVHAYASLLGDPPRLLQEGLAEVLGCGEWSPDQGIDKSLDVERLIRTAELERISTSEVLATYPAAAGLTRFLIDHYGRAAYLQLYRETPHDASLAEIDREFVRAFGDDLGSVLAGWRAAPPQTSGGVCLYLAECSSHPLAPGETSIDGFACGDAIHPSTNLGFPLTWIGGLALEQPAGLRARALSEEPIAIDVRSCDTELRPWLLASEGVGNPVTLWTDLEAGSYYLALLEGSSEPEPVMSMASAQINLGSVPLLAGSCQAATEQVVQELGTVDLHSGLRGMADASLRFSVPQARSFGVAGVRRLEGDTLVWAGATSFTLCEGGCPSDGASCTDHTTDGAVAPVGSPLHLAPGVPYVLIIHDTGATDEVWLKLWFAAESGAPG